MAQRGDETEFDDSDEEDVEESEDTGTDDGDEEESEDDGEGEKPKGDERIRRLSREAKGYRIKLRQERQKTATLEAEIQRLKDEGVSGDEAKNLKAERDQLKSKVDELTETNKTLAVSGAIRDEMAELKLNPKKTRAILKQLDLDEIDYEDGEVSGVREALEDIAQEFPEWVLSQRDDEGDEGNGRTPGTPRKPRKKAPGGGLNKEALLKTYNIPGL